VVDVLREELVLGILVLVGFLVDANDDVDIFLLVDFTDKVDVTVDFTGVMLDTEILLLRVLFFEVVTAVEDRDLDVVTTLEVLTDDEIDGEEIVEEDNPVLAREAVPLPGGPPLVPVGIPLPPGPPPLIVPEGGPPDMFPLGATPPPLPPSPLFPFTTPP